MQGHKFLNAYFTDEERTIVESLWEEETTGTVRVEIIEAKDKDVAWEDLLTHIDIDTLHEMTFKQIRELDNQYKDQVIAIAKDRGMVYDIDSVNTDVYKAIAAALFAPFDATEDKEKLFMFKLQLFEVEEIRDSKDKEGKKKIRRAKTMLTACQAAINVYQGNT